MAVGRLEKRAHQRRGPPGPRRCCVAGRVQTASHGRQRMARVAASRQRTAQIAPHPASLQERDLQPGRSAALEPQQRRERGPGRDQGAGVHADQRRDEAAYVVGGRRLDEQVGGEVVHEVGADRRGRRQVQQVDRPYAGARRRERASRGDLRPGRGGADRRRPRSRRPSARADGPRAAGRARATAAPSSRTIADRHGHDGGLDADGEQRPDGEAHDGGDDEQDAVVRLGRRVDGVRPAQRAPLQDGDQEERDDDGGEGREPPPCARSRRDPRPGPRSGARPGGWSGWTPAAAANRCWRSRAS